jgi:hypothetical protein
MKQLILILTILTIVSCNDKKEIDTNKLIENKDISALEQKRYELVNQIDFLQKDLNTIISALNRLDSSKKEYL